MSDRDERPQVVLVNRCVVLDELSRVLLIRRALNDQSNAGQWEAPGGKLDEGQDLHNALEREVLEETGLVIVPAGLATSVHSEILTQGKYAGLPYVAVTGIGRKVGGEVRLSEEHDDFAWVDYEKTFEYELKYEVRKALTSFSPLFKGFDSIAEGGFFKERAALRMAAAIDVMVHRSILDPRSPAADARLGYGDPFTPAEAERLWFGKASSD